MATIARIGKAFPPPAKSMKMSLLAIVQGIPRVGMGHKSAFCPSHKVSQGGDTSTLQTNNCSGSRQSVEYDAYHKLGNLGHDLVVCRERTFDCRVP